MPRCNLSTFVNDEGAVVLAFEREVDGEMVRSAVALDADSARGLGRSLVERSHEAEAVGALLDSVKAIFAADM